MAQRDGRRPWLACQFIQASCLHAQLLHDLEGCTTVPTKPYCKLLKSRGDRRNQGSRKGLNSPVERETISLLLEKNHKGHITCGGELRRFIHIRQGMCSNGERGAAENAGGMFV